MKLVHYTHRGISAVAFVLMLAWGALFYFTIINEVMDETDDALANTRAQLVKMTLQHPEQITHNACALHSYTIRPLTYLEGMNYEDRFYDSLRYVEIENEYEPVRVMSSSFKAPDGNFYEMKIMQSTLERDDMVEVILICLAILFAVVWLCVALGTRLVLNRVFRPLNRLLHWLDKVLPGQPVPELENDTQIHEFNRLNEAALSMSKRSEKAYIEQKEFIENAAHELQTPLAVIRGKLELLADSEELNEEQLQYIDQLFGQLNRVVHLNKSLLLLSRINNGQFTESAPIELNRMIHNSVQMMQDIYAEKSLSVVWDEAGICIINMNESLARVLFDNLIKNAFVYTPQGGTIQLTIRPDEVRISNSGEESLDEDRIFTRFYHKSSKNKESNGLGLSIVKSVAELYGISLTYSYQKGMHVFVLNNVN